MKFHFVKTSMSVGIATVVSAVVMVGCGPASTSRETPGTREIVTARKQLAQELGCPQELMGDSAQMNMWLHKAVLKRVAENGGKVPKELLN